MARVLGVVAAVFGWLGWLTLSPSFGFPTLGTAAMVNRVLVPTEDPGFWLGWAVLLAGLIGAALVYLAAADRGLHASGAATGLTYGIGAFLVVGGIVMPLLGLADPVPAPAQGPPDPMRGTFMMLHLGISAPIVALIAWLIFGVVVGAAAGSRATAPARRRPIPSWTGRPALPRAVGPVAVVSAVTLLATFAAGWAVERALPWQMGTAQTAAPHAEPVQAVPDGTVFVSIIGLPQAAGGTLGPHAHVPGYGWSLDGVETITFHDGRTMRIGPGEAGFMGADEVHLHSNADDRVQAAALALAIIGLAGLAGFLGLRARPPGRSLWVALLLLTVAGAVGTWNPWSNDWLFISVRPEAARGGTMPLPSASRIYESPDLGSLPTGPYRERLEEITIESRTDHTVESVGATVLLVLDGRVEVERSDGPPAAMRVRDAIIVQPGESVVVSNPSGTPARVLTFAIEPEARR